MEGKNGGTLKPFEKGESGNPNGRPKGSLESKHYCKVLVRSKPKLKEPFNW
jgi:hypothetical protein